MKFTFPKLNTGSKENVVMLKTPKVFISYSHQDACYENKVLDFANKLRSEGIDADVDLYEKSPSEGWPRWMENQIREADFVLVLSSKSYYEKCYSTSKGKGVSWEVEIVYQYIYDSNCQNTKFIPIFFNENDAQYILTPIKSFTYYNVGTKQGYENLYWRLRGVTKNQRPPLGKLRPLPEKERKAMFFSTPIDLEKWNTAGWKGMLYLFAPGHSPVLGLVYRNYNAAKRIFSEWRQLAGNGYADEFIELSYVVPPFPKACWVYSDPERSFGKGYFVHIGPNIEMSISRAIKSGIRPEEILLTSISRYQWMDELNGSQNRDMFKHYVDSGTGYLLMPIGIKDEAKPIEEKNLIIDFDFSVKMNSALFKVGTEIKGDDMCKAVLNKADLL